MKVDRGSYVCEMTAAGAAIGAFVVVYLAGFAHAGVVLTLLLAWLPATALACIVARGVRHLMAVLFSLETESDLAAAASGAPPATISLSAEETARPFFRRSRR